MNCAVLLYICLFGIALVAALDLREAPPCNVAVRCSSEEDIVWATDRKECRVFRNACLMTTVNCERINNYQPEFEDVSQEECQKRCKKACPDVLEQVCADYNGKRRTFPNKCELTNHICNSGETYSLFQENECPQEISETHETNETNETD